MSGSSGAFSGWLAGGGEMGERIRAHSWPDSPIGPVETWSPALRNTLRIMLPNRFPQILWWGSELIQFYNDAYIPIPGSKHPALSFARPGRECWSEIWHIIGPLIATPFEGGPATWDEDILLKVHRHGFLEETHFTIAYSPVPDESAPGGIGGVLGTVHEITEKVIHERRARALRDLGSSANDAKTVEEACLKAVSALSQYDHDVPFVLAYLIEGDGNHARFLCGTSGIEPGSPFCPAIIDLGATDQIWPLSETAVTVSDLAARFGAEVPYGPWSDPPREAVIVPIRSNLAHQPAGLLVLGVSARLRLNSLYLAFYDLVASQFAMVIANARALEAERKRAEALAEIDRAKTLFFSNISHEFRTPLTLMLGPLEDALASPGLPGKERERLDTAYRNSLRLLKLVNTLLDFSRVEAGRVKAIYQPADLSAVTADLASTFRSACDRAGLKLIVRCLPLPEPVYLDREMWEKIILNLLSNAFKFTFAGEIEVSCRANDDYAEVTIRDTGIGIQPQELPNLFERFHRVENARGRTHEGTGIGLALIKELVKLHGGTIGVTSVVGEGSAFTVRLPFGTSQLPQDRLAAGRTEAQSAMRAEAYVDEALRWLPNTEVASSDDRPEQVPGAIGRSESKHPLLLIADDNADMRGYLRSILGSRYEVETVANGAAALAAIRARRPALAILDVMMPQPDGFAVLSEIRNDAMLKEVPVVLLSARAGEEAASEGLGAGADDYIVKPFSAQELLARVHANIEMARIRSEAARALGESEERLRRVLETDAVGVLFFDPEGTLTDANDVFLRMTGYSREDIGSGKLTWRVMTPPEYVAASEAQLDVFARSGRVGPYEKEYYHKDGSRSWMLFAGRDLGDGSIVEFAIDISGLKKAEAALRESEERERQRRHELETLLTAIPAAVLIAEDKACSRMTANRAGREILGLPEGGSPSKSAAETELPRHFDVYSPEGDVVPPHELPMQRAAATGVTVEGSECELRFSDGRRKHILGNCYPLFDATGESRGAVGAFLDITERKRQEEQIKVLLREVNHRAKNMLTLVQAVARQTAASDAGDFLRRFGERIQSLAASQDLLVKAAWQGVCLSELVRSQLAHFKDLIGTRIAIKGPPLLILASAAQTIGMAMHELATNAGKYGALSGDHGRVEIAWTVGKNGTDADAFTMSWCERGGPPVVAPPRKGFGSTVISTLAEKSLDGKVDLEFKKTGLSWRMRCPGAQVIDRAAAVQPAEGRAPGRTPGISPRPRILVVEDEPLVALEIAQVLEDGEFDVIGPARSVAPALALIEEAGCDAAVLDINLGGETSEAVARRLLLNGTQFVTLSGYSRAQHPPIFNGAPALSKPLRPELLIAELHRCINGQASHSEQLSG